MPTPIRSFRRLSSKFWIKNNSIFSRHQQRRQHCDDVVDDGSDEFCDDRRSDVAVRKRGKRKQRSLQRRNERIAAVNNKKNGQIGYETKQKEKKRKRMKRWQSSNEKINDMMLSIYVHWLGCNDLNCKNWILQIWFRLDWIEKYFFFTD